MTAAQASRTLRTAGWVAFAGWLLAEGLEPRYAAWIGLLGALRSWWDPLAPHLEPILREHRNRLLGCLVAAAGLLLAARAWPVAFAVVSAFVLSLWRDRRRHPEACQLPPGAASGLGNAPDPG